MPTWQLITVTQTLVARCGELRCQRCDRRLKVGELVWSYRATARSSPKTHYYCKGCFRRLRTAKRGEAWR